MGPIARIAIFVCTLMLVGCDALDCVIDNHPKFSKANVSGATLNQEFEDTIKVSIVNSYMDYEYRFTYTIEGDLPPGIKFETSGREITFSGTPTELGEFPFRLTVVAAARLLNSNEDPIDAPEDLCNDTESRDMVLTVVQGF